LFILTGTLIGIVFAIIEIFFNQYSSKRTPLDHFVAVIAAPNVIIELSGYFYGLKLNNDRGWWRSDKVFFVFILYIILASFIFFGLLKSRMKSLEREFS
jgi:adenylate cyclase